jgi:hypothetical protein
MVFYVGLVSIAKKMYIFPSYLVTELCNTVVAIKRLEALCSLNLLQNMSYIKHNTTFTNDSLISYTSKVALANVREALFIEGDRLVGDFIHANRSPNLILLLACKIRCRMSLHSVLHIGDCSKTFMCIFARIPTRGIKPYNALQAKKKIYQHSYFPQNTQTVLCLAGSCPSHLLTFPLYWSLALPSRV